MTKNKTAVHGIIPGILASAALVAVALLLLEMVL